MLRKRYTLRNVRCLHRCWAPDNSTAAAADDHTIAAAQAIAGAQAIVDARTIAEVQVIVDVQVIVEAQAIVDVQIAVAHTIVDVLLTAVHTIADWHTTDADEHNQIVADYHGEIDKLAKRL